MAYESEISVMLKKQHIFTQAKYGTLSRTKDCVGKGCMCTYWQNAFKFNAKLPLQMTILMI